MPSVSDKRATYRKLHEQGCFVQPNPWDIGSARFLQSLGFPALATTSAGFAWTKGRPDTKVSCDDMLAHLAELAQACDVPLNADFENAYADHPEGVARNVARAIDTGIAGLSIEDSTGEASRPLFALDEAVLRVKAARAAVDQSGSGVVLTARAECLLVGINDMEDVVRRLKAYADAGADCLYAPGLRSREDIAAVIAAVLPKPVNILNSASAYTVADLAALGARRISVGGALARTAWAAAMMAAKDLASQGSFAGFASGKTAFELETFFKADVQSRSTS